VRHVVAVGLLPDSVVVRRLNDRAAFLYGASEASHLLGRPHGLAQRSIILVLKIAETAIEPGHREPNALHHRHDSLHMVRQRHDIAVGLGPDSVVIGRLHGRAAVLHAPGEASHLF